jgi:carboxymethylenebutenolidase
MSDAIIAESIRITGHGGDEVEAYSARPLEPGKQIGGVVVIHHMPGYDIQTKEIARRFASEGYNAVLPNLYWR